MLRWVLAFLAVAVFATLLAFSGVAGTSSGIARILFVVFLIVFILSVLVGLLTGRKPMM